MDQGTATLEATRGESIAVEKIDGAVTSAGFTPRGMTATALGTAVARGQTWLLQWEGGEIELAGEHAELADGKKVRATGTLAVDRDGASTSLSMTVSEVEAVER